MKTLLILRHAKSSWEDAHLADHDRPLNKRGLRDAPRMGQLLRREEMVPSLIVSSTAVRAAMTAELVADAAGYDGNIIETSRLYHAYPDAYVEVAQGVGGEANSVMMVGHNPCIAELVEELSGHYERMPTAALAVFRVPIELWQELSLDARAELGGIWRPKELEGL